MRRAPDDAWAPAGAIGAWAPVPVVDMKVIVIPRSSSGAEVAQHGQYATMVAVAGRQPEFGEDVVDVLLDGAAADHERAGDAGVGPAFGHEGQNLALARGQLAERVAAAGQQLRHHLGVERAAAVGHSGQRVEELGHVGHPVLQQVADAVRAAGDQLGGVPLLHPLGQHEHADLGPAVAHHQGGAQAFVGERGRHPYVDHYRVRGVLGHGAQEPLGLARDRGDLVAGLGEQPGQPLAQQYGILRDDYPHGSSAAMIVGPPTGDSTDNRPSTPDIRSASPDRPVLVMSAPPIPSSLIMTVSVPGEPRPSTTTLAWLARERLATLVSASATTK